ncbi:protein-tyrosine phosphatase-like protein [Podospora australis]|uniref:protein-tyrosine-phosphatase n=1 Tax=Podospora australis TaxID=1536484 RepID=A0AAN6WRH7_9PEZI|nr:protein-tyrosine phosphatase-like protein [Podospora australis]
MARKKKQSDPAISNTTTTTTTTTTSKSTSSSKAPISTVIPDFLFLASVSATSSENSQLLLNTGITDVLSVGKSPLFRQDGITYHRLSLQDNQWASILAVADEACKIIESVKSLKGKVLVHCFAGISRSPSIIAAYLMKSEGMTLRQSLEALIRARDQVKPNTGFLRQLFDMEKELLGNKGIPSIPSFKRLIGYGSNDTLEQLLQDPSIREDDESRNTLERALFGSWLESIRLAQASSK